MCVWWADLVCRDAVELWQQPETIFLFDQDSLQGLLILLNLMDRLEEAAASRFVLDGASDSHSVALPAQDC